MTISFTGTPVVHKILSVFFPTRASCLCCAEAVISSVSESSYAIYASLKGKGGAAQQ